MNIQRFLIVPLLATAAAVSQSPLPPNPEPHLEHRGEATQLVVDGAPMLLLGGELHNSSSSSVAYMAPVWPRLTAAHLNTVLVPIAWETIEPTEGHFDFTVVDGLLAGARENHLHLVPLWFGTWKNTFSSYVPDWVKRDQARFPRVETSQGRGTERLSPFSATVRDADARAFAALMHHLREIDAHDHTVLMVQVENEVGVLPESRDHSPIAERLYAAPVPAALTQYLTRHRTTLHPELREAWEQHGARTAGTWTEVFGATPFTDDLFMAWHYATFTQVVAAAGKREYALPFYANAALIRPNYQPGQYNSGGPLPHSADLWRAGAPALDFLSPDIYFNEFVQWASAYSSLVNPLFIPEAQGGTAGAANSLYAFGQLHAIGFSVFGIDDQGNLPLDLAGITDPSHPPDNTAIAAEFGTLAALAPRLLAAQRDDTVHTALLEGEPQRAGRLVLDRAGEFTANISRAGANPARLSVLCLQTGPAEFLITGSGDSQITFSSDRPGLPIVGISSIDEVYLHPDAPDTLGRRLNGDETGQGQSLRLFATDAAQSKVYRVRLYRYR